MTCGSRTIWFRKNEPHTIYCDIRDEEWEGVFGTAKNHNTLKIHPDIKCSFTNLPFEDESFNLVVFDPPHLQNLTQSSWMRKEYGSLDGDWKPIIHKGFDECMRVLKSERQYTNGTTAVLYHQRIALGMFHECGGTPEEAKQYKTKKDAIADRDALGLGRAWEAIRV